MEGARRARQGVGEARVERKQEEGQGAAKIGEGRRRYKISRSSGKRIGKQV